jgi:radical SAM protein with 4Fe4S-binding SPASM domain
MFDRAVINLKDKSYLFDMLKFDLRLVDFFYEPTLTHVEPLSYSSGRETEIAHNVLQVQSSRQSRFDKRSIKNLIIMPYAGCKANCAYCYTTDYKHDDTCLTPPQIFELMKEHQIPPSIITSTIIIGGEPLLNLDTVKFIIDYFPNAEHTICSGFVVDDTILQDLLNFIMFKPNVEVSLSIDPIGSSRPMDGRIVSWMRLYHNLIGSRIRIKSTITSNSWNIHGLRGLLHEQAKVKINFDGVSYNNEKFVDIDPSVTQNIRMMFEQEYSKLITGMPESLTFLNLNAAHHIMTTTIGRTCDCGFNWFTINWKGQLTFCDTMPFTKEADNYILDTNLDCSGFRDKRVQIHNKCNTCPAIRVCGGSCSVGQDHQLYCYVTILNIIYSMAYLLYKYENTRNSLTKS